MFVDLVCCLVAIELTPLGGQPFTLNIKTDLTRGVARRTSCAWGKPLTEVLCSIVFGLIVELAIMSLSDIPDSLWDHFRTCVSEDCDVCLSIIESYCLIPAPLRSYASAFAFFGS